MTKTSDLALGLSPELKSKVLVADPLLLRRYRGVKMTTFTVAYTLYIVNRLGDEKSGRFLSGSQADRNRLAGSSISLPATEIGWLAADFFAFRQQ
jgi:hypothetical protein